MTDEELLKEYILQHEQLQERIKEAIHLLENWDMYNNLAEVRQILQGIYE